MKGVKERSALILEEAEKAASCRNLLQLYRQEMDKEVTSKKQQDLTILNETQGFNLFILCLSHFLVTDWD